MTDPYLEWLRRQAGIYRPNRPQQLPDIEATAPRLYGAPSVERLLGGRSVPRPTTTAPRPLAATILGEPSDATRTPIDRFRPRTTPTGPAPLDRPAFVNPDRARELGLTGERNATGLADLITGALDPAQASPQLRAMQLREAGVDVPAPASTPLENFSAGAQRQLGMPGVDLEEPQPLWQMAGSVVPFMAQQAVAGPLLEAPIAARLLRGVTGASRGARAGRMLTEEALGGMVPQAAVEGLAVGRGEETWQDAGRNLAIAAPAGAAFGSAMRGVRALPRAAQAGLGLGAGIAATSDDEDLSSLSGMAAIPLAVGFAGDATAAGRMLGGRFYSRLADHVAGMKIDKAPVQTWLGKLSAGGNFKKEEFDQVLRPWLAAQDPQARLTRDEVVQAVHENLPELREYLQGYSQVPKGTLSADQVQYEEYLPPGGTNPRNVLLQVPPLGRGWDDNLSAGAYFQSNHWRPRDVFAHTRMTDLPAVDGGEYLNLAELQSDWHQRGREEGYQQPLPANAKERLTQLDQERYAVGAQIDALRADLVQQAAGYEPGQGGGLRPNDLTREQRERYEALREASEELRALQARDEEIFRERDVLNSWHTNQRHKPPEGPFAPTSQWMGIGLKRAIDEAIGLGRRGLTWSTPEAISSALGLGGRVESLALVPTERATQGPGEFLHASALPMGSADVTDPGKLEELIGADLAARLRAAEPNHVGHRVLRGDDLHIVPKGNRTFYGEMIPQWLRAYGKELGIPLEVKDTDFRVGEVEFLRANDNPVDVGTFIHAHDRLRRSSNPDDQAAAEELADMADQFGDFVDPDTYGTEAYDNRVAAWWRGLSDYERRLAQTHTAIEPTTPPPRRVLFSDVVGQEVDDFLLRETSDMLKDRAEDADLDGDLEEKLRIEQRSAHMGRLADDLRDHLAQGRNTADWFDALSARDRGLVEDELDISLKNTTPTKPVRRQQSIDFPPELIERVKTKGQPLLGLLPFLVAAGLIPNREERPR